jgi:hypothetical protein
MLVTSLVMLFCCFAQVVILALDLVRVEVNVLGLV